MNVSSKIVFLDGQFPAILFPVGHKNDGGSCAFITDNCRQYCPAQETNIHEIRALIFFKENKANIIIEKILDDLSDYGLMHLYWWSWGDCLPELSEKIIKIMLTLSKIGILQNGFTRNYGFWVKINKLSSDNLKIGFHLENQINLFDKEYANKVVCLPDVRVNKAELYYNADKIARCCGIWCDWILKKETRSADCQECYMFKQGCFFEG